MSTNSNSIPRVRGFVYLAVNRERGLVRVGYSTEPKAAMKKLQTANPCELAMTLIIPGTEHTYRALTNKLAGCHVANGWYDSAGAAGILFEIGASTP